MTLPIALSTLNGQYGTEYNVLMAGSPDFDDTHYPYLYLCAEIFQERPHGRRHKRVKLMKRIRFNAENRALAWQAPSGTANIVQEGLGDGAPC